MSAPTPAPGDESPREGYYPDPSIPGYVRYWNGASWVPGTSRPAPQQGGTAPAAPPAPAANAAPQHTAQRPAPVDETGPMYLDDVGGSTAFGGRGEAPSRPEPASAWQADTSRQTGFGGERDHRVSWGGPDPRAADEAAPAATPRTDDGTAGRVAGDPHRPAVQDPTRGALPGMRDGSGEATDGPTRLPAGSTGASGDAGRPPTDGTVTIRATGPAGTARPPHPREEAAAPADGTMTIRGATPGGAPRTPSPQAPAPRPHTPAARPPAPQPPAARPHTPAARPPEPSPEPPRAYAPARTGHPVNPLTPGPGGGSASWAQQAHPLSRPGQPAAPRQAHPSPPQQQGGRPEQQPVTPWKPPVDDHFQQLARAQASARPAGLGKRLAARLVDAVVLGALVGAIALPLVTRATEHIDGKIEAAKQSGETVTVWLLDSTTAGLLGAVIGAFLVVGFVLEALPTAKWGRTLGKKLCGLEVRDIESHGPPTLGAALRRWLVYGVLCLLVVGVVNVLWCLVDRPWRQCWHDKAARTFVAG
ncbi:MULTISPECIES: RDD family protein [Streptomyces]|uniref:RDD family membrane protein YckC n=1 Tax=Streptomyces clavifer TaxID=68188 RepID=A0ABS4VAZ5_9ACTN|nr:MULTISPECIES: RDD family protein [Streptomyces]MBP2361095.1 putative RDD family membrane protein YckC [Streptomyces clavifer]MDX2746271.1 RDD family protein [Streptomyces sp. NRRL_B-2557]RPK77110.1 RDD family protein [Streptomyces sp. ADI97-07]